VEFNGFAHERQALVLLLGHGTSLAAGPARAVLTQERLAALYGTEVKLIESAGERAYLPG